jgi:hypothetical protein
MPRCRDCGHYRCKDWSVNYECKLEHSTPNYGDTQSCSDYEEQYTIGYERGWSYREEKEREGKTYQDDLDTESESGGNESGNLESQQNNYSTYSGGYISSSNSSGLELFFVALFLAPALYFIIAYHSDPMGGMEYFFEKNILSNFDRHQFSFTYLFILIYMALIGLCIVLTMILIPLLIIYVVYIIALSIGRKM